MKKKILFTTLMGYPNPNLGGPTRIIYDLLKNLDYSKYVPYFLSYDIFKKYSSNEELDTNQDKNIYAKRNLGYKLYNKINLYRNIVTSDYYLKYHYRKKDKYFSKFIDEVKDFDIINSHDPLSAYYFLDLKKPKKILTIHSKGTQVSEMKESNLRSKCLKDLLLEFGKREIEAFLKYDIITFPSKAAKQIFLQDIKLNDTQFEKIKVIYNGINLESIRNIKVDDVLDKYKIQKNSYDITLLNVAQHVKPKNIGLIIQSQKILRDQFNTKALLVNVGEGYMTEDFKSIIETNALNDYVKFLGMIPNDDVIRLMKSLDIFIQVSEKIIFDLVLLEALGSGSCVLATEQGGNLEVIKDKVNGYFLREINPEAIAVQILELKNSDEKNFIRINAKTFIQNFDVKRMIDCYNELYCEVLS